MTDSESDIDCTVSDSCRGSLGVELPLLWLEPPEPVSLLCRTSALDDRFTFFIGVLLRGELSGEEERIGVFAGLMSKPRRSDFGVPGVVALECFLKSSKTLNKQFFFIYKEPNVGQSVGCISSPTANASQLHEGAVSIRTSSLPSELSLLLVLSPNPSFFNFFFISLP